MTEKQSHNDQISLITPGNHTIIDRPTKMQVMDTNGNLMEVMVIPVPASVATNPTEAVLESSMPRGKMQ